MSDNSVNISRKEFTSEKVLEYLEDGKRVIVTVGKAGITKEIVLRKRQNNYICDTGFKLFEYDNREEMKDCIERLRLTEPE